MGSVKDLRHMVSDCGKPTDDTGLRTMAVDDVGVDFSDESAYMQPCLDIVRCGNVSDQLGNGDERGVLLHFRNELTIIIVDSAGPVRNSHIEFAMVNAVDDINHIASAASHGLLDYEYLFLVMCSGNRISPSLESG